MSTQNSDDHGGGEPEVSAPSSEQTARFLTEAEAAAVLRLKPESLRQVRKAGKAPPFVKLFGRNSRPLYPYADLLKWCEDRMVRQGETPP